MLTAEKFESFDNSRNFAQLMALSTLRRTFVSSMIYDVSSCCSYCNCRNIRITSSHTEVSQL